jgi:hypothetical protein
LRYTQRLSQLPQSSHHKLPAERACLVCCQLSKLNGMQLCLRHSI